MELTVTEALLARTVDYGEADRICELLTRAHGRLTALARGARRSRKRFGGALALFVLGEATLRPAARGDLLALVDFHCREDLSAAISTDLLKVAHGSYMLELARELWPVAQPEPELFALVCDALRALANAETAAPALLRAYELHLLGQVGLAPSLSRCVACGATVGALGGAGGHQAGVSFHLARGGVCCSRCEAGGIRLGAEVHAALMALQGLPLEEAAALRLTGSPARELRELMLQLIRGHLGKDLRSLAFISQLRGT